MVFINNTFLLVVIIGLVLLLPLSIKLRPLQFVGGVILY